MMEELTLNEVATQIDVEYYNLTRINRKSYFYFLPLVLF